MATRRNSDDDDVPDLSASVIAIVLAGWGAVAPEPSAHGFGRGMLALFDQDGVADTWRQHQDYLRATARRWGWEPRYGGMFFGEAAAAGANSEANVQQLRREDEGA